MYCIFILFLLKFILLHIKYVITCLRNVHPDDSRGWGQPPDLAALSQLPARNVDSALPRDDSMAEAVEVLLIFGQLLDSSWRQDGEL